MWEDAGYDGCRGFHYGLLRPVWQDVISRTKFETTKMFQCLWNSKTISQKKKAFGANWKSLDFIFIFMEKKKKEVPILRNIHLCLWNSYVLKNAWRERREKWREVGKKGGGGEVEKECEELGMWRAIWPSKYLPLKFQNTLFYFLFLIKWSKYKPGA